MKFPALAKIEPTWPAMDPTSVLELVDLLLLCASWANFDSLTVDETPCVGRKENFECFWPTASEVGPRKKD